PEAPPDLSQDKIIFLNVEATGLRWWAGDLPLAISVFARNRGYYLPWGHSGLGNLSEEVVKEWARRELWNKFIVNINTRFDVHMLRKWGIDLEAQNNTVSDVGHMMALLDDHRLRMN